MTDAISISELSLEGINMHRDLKQVQSLGRPLLLVMHTRFLREKKQKCLVLGLGLASSASWLRATPLERPRLRLVLGSGSGSGSASIALDLSSDELMRMLRRRRFLPSALAACTASISSDLLRLLSASYSPQIPSASFPTPASTREPRQAIAIPLGNVEDKME
ncbi:hypothetical protein HRG_004955 [Hirsutella rhossiliensis]|uniref:Uncharacterized protein n=1 Tax=Hirsutella rhossiliensis TaxID=111463 RepID=A0A9P8N4J9_9HYPO|nr:uncharacterized protein HRG_04955 [Hirsutella rhossiliensis]KAH0964527.1 hypothetical protein HRG_04955 [Hirsutella rhossiliensis]